MRCFVTSIQDKNISVYLLTGGVQFNQWKLNRSPSSFPNSTINIVNKCLDERNSQMSLPITAISVFLLRLSVNKMCFPIIFQLIDRPS